MVHPLLPHGRPVSAPAADPVRWGMHRPGRNLALKHRLVAEQETPGAARGCRQVP